MRLLILCNKKLWDTHMCRGRFHAMAAIMRHPEVEAIKDGPNFPNWEDVPAAVKKYKPDVILWRKPLQMKNYDHIDKDIPKVMCLNEMWNVDFTTAEITKTNTNLVIHHHKNDEQYFSHLKDKHIFVNISHCAEKTVFKDYNLPKEYNVLLIGVLAEVFYPLRDKLHEAIQLIPDSKVLEHPGYVIRNVDEQMVNYAKEINKAKIVVTCSSKYKYSLAKYAEVPMCKTFLVSDIPDERQDFFRKFIGEIDDNSSVNQIVDKLIYWLSNDTLREERTKIGYDMTLSEYTQEHYADRFVKTVKKTFNL